MTPPLATNGKRWLPVAVPTRRIWARSHPVVNLTLKVHVFLQLHDESLYLAVAIARKYLRSKTKATCMKPKLLACSAVWIASKFADLSYCIPSLGTMCRICAGVFCTQDFVDAEKDILAIVGWSLHFETFETCLQEHPVVFPEENDKIGRLARFLGKVTLLLDAFEAYDAPSTAMGCLALAQFIVMGSNTMHNLGSPWREVAVTLDSFLRENIRAIPTYMQRNTSNRLISFLLSGSSMLIIPFAPSIAYRWPPTALEYLDNRRSYTSSSFSSSRNFTGGGGRFLSPPLVIGRVVGWWFKLAKSMSGSSTCEFQTCRNHMNRPTQAAQYSELAVYDLHVMFLDNVQKKDRPKTRLKVGTSFGAFGRNQGYLCLSQLPFPSSLMAPLQCPPIFRCSANGRIFKAIF
ncbi:hypothetical protein BKA70DRAFT_1240987 [Coprinopsis sp. MPI-PUGE-AT-0042]|nr:hypothetical protein BKA70DRAFT_1240987 [Coprinopsis sp. MPI-PUGE-AT-0042]